MRRWVEVFCGLTMCHVLTILSVYYVIPFAFAQATIHRLAIVFANILLVDTVLFANRKNRYVYSLDVARHWHLMATFCFYFDNFDLPDRVLGFPLTCIVVFVGFTAWSDTIFPLHYTDITLLLVFLWIWPDGWHTGQIGVVVCGLVGSGYCLYVSRRYTAWGILLICHIVLIGPSLSLWTCCLFVLSKAGLIAGLDIITVATLQAERIFYYSVESYFQSDQFDLKHAKSELTLLPALFQPLSLDCFLYLHNRLISSSRIIKFIIYICYIDRPQVLSRLSPQNRCFLHDLLGRAPNFPFFVLLYRSHFKLVAWQTGCPPFLALFGGHSTARDNKHLVGIRVFVQRMAAKMEFLWLLEREKAVRMGRLSKYLIQDLFEYF